MVIISLNGNNYQFDETVRVDLSEDINTGKKRVAVYYEGADETIITTINTMKDDLTSSDYPLVVTVSNGDSLNETLNIIKANYNIQISSFLGRTIYMSEQ